jgi:hypothetical protein
MTHREQLLAVTTVLVSIVGFLLLLELVMNLLPVASGLQSLPVSMEDPVLRYRPNRPYVFSHGAMLDNVNYGKVNNAGYVNEQDYVKSGLPLIAIVGDSFIEAQMVPYEQTVQGRLAKALANKFRVYSFANSGAPLSQYLMLARYAVDEYQAKAVVINVVFNDFDESHLDYKFGTTGFWLYVPDANGQLRLQLLPHNPGRLWILARKSALARYILINLKFNYLRFIANIRDYFAFLRPVAAQTIDRPMTAPDADERRLKISYEAIDAFFRDLPRLVKLPPERVLFTIDGFRYPEAVATGTYFDLMRKAFRAKAQALGYEAIDLDPLFFERYRRNGERFEFVNDPHWNGTGHAVAAAAVRDWLRRSGLDSTN